VFACTGFERCMATAVRQPATECGWWLCPAFPRWLPVRLQARSHVMAPPCHQAARRAARAERRGRAGAQVRGTLPPGQDVLAFQCRNPIHRAHYELFTRALEADNVRPGAICLVHPTCGPTQARAPRARSRRPGPAGWQARRMLVPQARRACERWRHAHAWQPRRQKQPGPLSFLYRQRAMLDDVPGGQRV